MILRLRSLTISIIVEQEGRLCIGYVTLVVDLLQDGSLGDQFLLLNLNLDSAFGSFLIFLYFLHIWNVSCVWSRNPIRFDVYRSERGFLGQFLV